ncbi:DUF4387 domain-containing protein [Ramlibacter sp. G-1-2-2]|uniref:DUF4387 domain-containing protein n=1 Tax=Ramlibacter agri TaxID=2728837 RepID=A0A848GUF5_9BURK|nr:DUF4387 domain-containing protein [Ramlibacter agri]NML42256.1 DUF4387 domain-containing protein [Ramlibacter agri]
MPKLSEVCHHVRSKNAGPFWITLDFSFADQQAFDRYCNAPAFDPATIGQTMNVDASLVKVFRVPKLRVVKVSYPRRKPQGGMLERDMHGGQQYVRFLDLEMA